MQDKGKWPTVPKAPLHWAFGTGPLFPFLDIRWTALFKALSCQSFDTGPTAVVFPF